MLNMSKLWQVVVFNVTCKIQFAHVYGLLYLYTVAGLMVSGLSDSVQAPSTSISILSLRAPKLLPLGPSTWHEPVLLIQEKWGKSNVIWEPFAEFGHFSLTSDNFYWYSTGCSYIIIYMVWNILWLGLSVYIKINIRNFINDVQIIW